MAAILAAGIAVTSVAAESSAIPQMKGLVMSSGISAKTGLWTLPTTPDGEWSMDIGMDPGYATFYGGVAYEDVYYATRCNAQYGTIVYVDAYSMEDGTKLWTNYPDVTALPYDLTYNPYDGKIYGFFSNKKNTGMVFGTISYDRDGETVTPIKEMDGNWIAIAAAASGELYAISSEVDVNGTNVTVNSSSLYKIDRLTGETDLIGETGQLPLITGSATIDPRSGRMFWTVGPDGSSTYLCEVDLTTGVATKILDFNGNQQVGGLYVPTPPAEDDAPAAITDAVATFEGGSLSGSLTFNAPTTLYDGTAPSGALTYAVLLNGAELTKGNTTFGGKVNVDVTVPERGEYEFTISVANDKGSSPKVAVSRFVGFGVPVAPAGVSASNVSGNVTVSWSPVASSSDGGFIDEGAIKYTVKRMPGDVVVAANTTATSVEDTPDVSAGMAAFSYVVTADNHGLLSEGAESNKVVCGIPLLPWSEDFKSEDSMGFFTVIDANEDGKTWEYYSNVVRAKYGSVVMDDWLISPGLQLESGKMYYVTFKAHSYNERYPEKIEAKWGAGAAVADMTNDLVAPTTLGVEYETLGGFVTPSVSGIYHVGLHGISDANMFYLEVCEFAVAAGINGNAPASPGELTVTPDPAGDYKAAISLKAPSTDMSGNAISSLDKIELRRGDVLIKTFDNPATGATLTYDDVLETGGDYVYSAVAFKGDVGGEAATVTAFVGTPVAAAPEAVAISEVADGKISLSWDKVTLSATGDPINPDKVRYNIYDANSYGELVAENVTEIPYVFQGVETGEQKFVQYSVAAVTDGGESDKTSTASIPAGTPYVDFHESYAGGQASTIYATERINYGNWAVETDGEVSSADGDGGFMVMNGYFGGYCGAMTTGKISLADMKAPTLRFYSYTPDNSGLDVNPMVIDVRTEEGEWKEVFNKTVVEMGADQGWHEVLVPLTEFAGANVAIRFTATTSDRPYISTYIDNLKVEDLVGVDLEITEINAPVHVRTGESFTVSVGLTNNGSEDASGFNVELYADDVLYDTIDDETVASSGKTTVEFTVEMSAMAEEPISYKAVVSHPDDTALENNESVAVTVIPVVSPLPAPASLKAVKSDDGVDLAWDAPMLAAESATAVTDDFESTEAWSHFADGWAMRDLDRAAVCGFGEVEIPGIEPGKTFASFFMFSATGIFEGNKPLAPYSGKQYLAAFARYDNGTTDDWAISPELSGEAQTISFYARSYSASYPERIQVLYSTGSLEPSDFVATDFNVDAVPGTWTRYDVSIPQGARYFAIRSCATNSFMLMIDDVTYIPFSSHDLEVTGYNVYRDNERVNDAPVTGTAYADNVADPDAHTWVVTAVYGERESKGSNAAKAETSSLDEAISGAIKIAVADGKIIVTGCDGKPVMVSAIDGKLIYNSLGRSVTEVPVGNGVYVVKAADVTRQVVGRD